MTTTQIHEPLDIEAELLKRCQIAIIWSPEDVQEVRPDLSHAQSWQVLQRVNRCHDCNTGITWDTLRITADDMFPTP